LTQEDVLEVFNSFLGEQEQIPPMYSAVKKDGKKLYELAREGKVIEREPRRINISLLEVLKFYLPKADFRVKCSKGTFIRTLCSDIGKKLNTGAVLFDLRRTASGEFDIEDAFSVEEIKTWTQDDLFEAVKKCTSF
jgi:tRNA pseudouridine55 synthase